MDLRKAYGLMLLQYAAAFQELKGRDQEALHMVEVEGLSYAEVGERLKVGRSNTKMIVFRARQRLRARMQGYYASAGIEAPASAPATEGAPCITGPKEGDASMPAALPCANGRTPRALAG